MTFTEKEKALISDINACVNRMRELARAWVECGFAMHFSIRSDGLQVKLMVNEIRTIDLPMSQQLVDQAQ